LTGAYLLNDSGAFGTVVNGHQALLSALFVPAALCAVTCQTSVAPAGSGPGRTALVAVLVTL